jgi:putative DNA primase/helicase
VKYLEEGKIPFQAGTLNGIIKLLKHSLHQPTWDKLDGLTPFQNGLFNLQNKFLDPYTPQAFVTWCLPYNYEAGATCEPIDAWLREIMDGDEQRVELLLSYLYCILFSLVHLQRYLECIGVGGTGKSTFLNLAMRLMGEKNVFATSLRRLSGRFELANLQSKRLIVIPDSEGNFAGSTEILKTITGQDPVPYEIKYGSRGTFTPQALVLIAGNTPMFTNDSGIARRRILLSFEHQVPPEKRRNVLEELDPYLPGLLNRLFGMDRQRVEALIHQPEQYVKSLQINQTELLIHTHPLAAWLFHAVEPNSESRTFVGTGEASSDGKLYASYLAYCRASHSKPESLRLFSAKLLELCNQLKWPVSKEKHWQQGVYFEGLRLRCRGELISSLQSDDSSREHVS